MDNISNFFNENIYYDPKFIITILENLLESNFEEIKTNIYNANIIVNEKQIKAFLNQKLEEENPQLKQRVEQRKIAYEKNRDKNEKLTFNWEPLTQEEKEEIIKENDDNRTMNKYQFEPYTLSYFEKYTTIIKNKLLTLLYFIEKISNKDITNIQELMTKLDIVLNENGYISKDDIIRLIHQIIINIQILNNKVNTANNLTTYLTFKISISTLRKNGWTEEEIYPNETLLDSNISGIQYILKK